jgi:papain like cysteine protease AvrRpt2
MELAQELVNADQDLGVQNYTGGALPTFPIQQQQMSQWCWAACTSSVSDFYGDSPVLTQAALEAAINNKPSCAYGPLTSFCNDTGDLADSLAYVNHFVPPVAGVLSPGQVLSEITVGRPVCCQMYIPGVGGHTVVIVDAQQQGTQVTLMVADPANGQILPMYYDDFRDNYQGNGSWSKSYTTS